jgi:hypothetical protein
MDTRKGRAIITKTDEQKRRDEEKTISKEL